MKNEQIKAESDDIRAPFKEFIRKFKKQKTALVAFAFIILLVIIAIISYFWDIVHVHMVIMRIYPYL